MATTIKDEGPVVGVCWDEGGALIDAFVIGFRSAKTRSNYRANLRDWMRWAAGVGVDAGQAERLHVESYIRGLEGRGYAPNTICQRIATLSSFYRWAVIEGRLATNPVDGARRPRKPTGSAANGLSRHELTDWLDAAEGRGGDSYACACLLALNGLRVGELCAANVEDLGESTWHHTLTLRASTTKGYKPAVVALAPRTVQAVGLAVAHRRSGALLLNRHGRRMTPYNVQYLVKTLCHGIGVDRPITPHSLGHSAITMALDAGIGLRDVQDFARHEDPKTARRYDRSPQPAQPPRHLRHRPVPRRRQLTVFGHAKRSDPAQLCEPGHRRPRGPDRYAHACATVR